MDRQQQLLELVGLIYDAADEPALWPGFLKRFAQVTRSTAVYLHNHLPVEGHSAGGLAYEFDPAFTRSHNAYYWKLSPNASTPPGSAGTPGVRVWREIVSYADLRKTEFFHDWMRPQGVLDTFGAILERPGHEGRTMLSGSRRIRDPVYDEEDLRLFDVLRPHLCRAISMGRRLARARSELESMQDALDRVRMGLIFVDRGGRVLRANRWAEELISQGDGLAVSRGRLTARGPDASRALERLIGSAAATSNGRALSPGGWMTAPRAGRRALSVLVSPLRSSRDGEPERGAAALVLVGDAERPATAPVDVLRRLFSLSRAEGKVVSLLARGKNPEEIAGELSVQANTIRAHLKSVFAKTGARRQTDIVLLVERTLGRIEG